MSSVAVAPSTQELVLGRYRPIRPLGSGGSGSVWLALDEQTGLDVALKIIPREGKAAARAEREALAARRLRHERCVRAYDVGHDPSHVYIAYEYVPGRTLREAIRAGAVTDADAVEIAAQVLDALAHAHRTGIVHRDVKPANVLLEDRDEIMVRLLDFGLAQFDGADTLTAVGDVPGTLAYISPERLAGDEASPASDVWAVGVLLWEMLADRHPFWGMPLQEVARAIQTGAPPLETERSGLPRRLVAAVNSALSPDPGARPRASDLATALRNSLRQGSARAERVDREVEPEVVAAPARLHARRVVPVGLAVVGAVLGATMLPFWPPGLVAAIAVAAGLATWFRPPLGLAIVLAAPVFPLGNVAEGAAILYGVLALAWLVLAWRDARWGLLFVTGPLLAGVGLLALVPLAMQPARGWLRRGIYGATAVLAAALAAGLANEELPAAQAAAGPLGINALTSPQEIALALWGIARPASGAPDRGRRGRRRVSCAPVGASQVSVRIRSRRVRHARRVDRCRSELREHPGPRGRVGDRSGRPRRASSCRGRRLDHLARSAPRHAPRRSLHSSRTLFPPMPVLRSIESKIENLFEGVFGRAFRTHVQPIELARKLVKEMDDHRSVSVSRVYVPNEYTVYLSPDDRKQFAGYEGSLVSELQEYLAEHARRERYALLTEPKVSIMIDDDLAVGEFGIATRLVTPDHEAVLPPVERPVEQPAETMVYRVPAAPPVAAAVLEPEPVPETFALAFGGKPHELAKPRVVLGRSKEADIRVPDDNVSRRHAEVRLEDDGYWIVDLGSTNGTIVNGKRVDRARLENDDRITLGSTEIVFGRSLSRS